MGYDVTFTLLSCLFFMGLVAFIAYRQTRGETDSAEGYFLAGRGLVHQHDKRSTAIRRYVVRSPT